VGFVIHSLSRCKAINSQGYSLIKTSSLSVSYYLQQTEQNREGRKRKKIEKGGTI